MHREIQRAQFLEQTYSGLYPDELRHVAVETEPAFFYMALCHFGSRPPLAAIAHFEMHSPSQMNEKRRGTHPKAPNVFSTEKG